MPLNSNMPGFFKLIFCGLYFISIYAHSQTDPAETQANYFKNTYADARLQFLQSVKNINNWTVELKSYPSPQNPDLITDVVWLKSKSANSRLQGYVSGVHGVEGYVGSALQSWLLTHPNILAASSDYFFIHALNPYGFKNKRRVTENNVDLNRSFMKAATEYNRENQAYEKLNSFLNPEAPARDFYFGRVSFLFFALKLIFENSIETLRKGILIGQYQYPKGIFFGGKNLPYQASILSALNNRIFKQYKKIFVVDIHTGYGKKNQLHLLANAKAGNNEELLNSMFQNRIDYGNKEKFYNATGDLISYLETLSSIEHSINGVVFEFGTRDTQTTLGSIESLRRLVLENQKFHHGSEIPSAEKHIDALFLDLFYPQDHEFRSIIFPQATAEILNINKQFH